MDLWKRNLYVTWITQIFSLVGFGFVLPFMPFFIQEVGVSDPVEVRRWVGVTSAVPSLLLGLMAPIWGALADRFGRKLMILRAMAGGCIVLYLMSLARTIEAVLVLRILQGLLAGTVTAAATLVAAGTPTRRLSSALGLLASSTFIGFSIGPMLGGITAEYFGYRTAFRIGAAILLFTFLLVLFLTREIQSQPGSSVRRMPIRRIRSLPIGFLLSLGLIFIFRFSRALPYSFIPLHIQEIRGTIDGSSAITGVISAMTGVAAAIAGLTVARIGDRIDKMKLISYLLLISAVFAIPLFFTKGVWDFGTCYVFVAFIMGGIEPNLLSYLSERTDSSRRGAVFGAITLVGGFGWSAAPLVGSAVSIALGIRWLFLFYAAGVAASWLFVIFFGRTITSRFQGAQRNE